MRSNPIIRVLDSEEYVMMSVLLQEINKLQQENERYEIALKEVFTLSTEDCIIMIAEEALKAGN
jgi:hypothetical protein